MTVHDLKISVSFFGAVANGSKTFEVRRSDRDFKVGDTLHLMEYEFIPKRYTGRTIDVTVTYICTLPQTNYLVGMSIDLVDKRPVADKIRAEYLRDISLIWCEDCTALECHHCAPEPKGFRQAMAMEMDP